MATKRGIQKSVCPSVTTWISWCVSLCGRISSNVSLPCINQLRVQCRCAACSLFCHWALHGVSIKGYEILRFFPWIYLTGTMLWSLLLQNGSDYLPVPDTNQIREERRCATCSLFCLEHSRTWIKGCEILVFPLNISEGNHFVVAYPPKRLALMSKYLAQIN